MKNLFILAIALCSASAFAARPNTQKLSCAAANDLVARSGAIVLSTGNGLYDRYVAHQGFCGNDEITSAAFVATKDSAACFIGYTCVTRNEGNSLGGVAAAARAVCKEGTTERFWEPTTGEGGEWNTYVCRNGKFVNLYKAPAAPEAPRVCREGSVERFLENSDRGGEDMVWNTYVCHHGKFVRTN